MKKRMVIFRLAFWTSLDLLGSELRGVPFIANIAAVSRILAFLLNEVAIDPVDCQLASIILLEGIDVIRLDFFLIILGR